MDVVVVERAVLGKDTRPLTTAERQEVARRLAKPPWSVGPDALAKRLGTRVDTVRKWLS